MSAPTPGPGWTEVPNADGVPDDAELLSWAPPAPGAVRYWIHTPPRPLPTAPGTVIRIDAGRVAGTRTLGSMGWTAPGDSEAVRSEDLAPQIDAYTVTAAPPAVTAAAVLADVRAAPNSYGLDLTPIATAYGVTLPPAEE